MNRLGCALITAALVFLPACGFVSELAASGDELTVYYLIKSAQSQSAVGEESRAFSGAGSRVESALEQIFLPPKSPGFESPFHADVELLSFELSEGVAHVDLSEEYAAMEGVSLTLADACVVLTLTQFSEVGYVRITASGLPHPSREDKLFTRDDFLVKALGLDPRDVEFELFFADPENRYVESELQSISLRDNNYAQYMVEMLIAGPKSERLGPVIPEGTRLLTLTLEENTCFVSFSEEFVTAAPGDAASARMTLVALANSLTGLDGIEKVELAIDGSPLREYFMYDVSGGLKREAAAIDSYQGTDVNLYYEGVGGALVQVAARVPTNNPDELQLAVLNEYLRRAAPTGLKKLVPEKTAVLDLGIENGTARLNLSKEFAAAGPDSAAPYALLKMLADNGQVWELVLYVDGGQFGEKSYFLADALH